MKSVDDFNDDDDDFFNNDDELFERERNRLGGLLLLKGLDNISSNNETFKKKMIEEFGQPDPGELIRLIHFYEQAVRERSLKNSSAN